MIKYFMQGLAYLFYTAVVVLSMWSSYAIIVNDVLPGKGIWQMLLGLIAPIGVACWVYLMTLAFYGVGYLIGTPAFLRKE
jgi:hypothetical protein